MPLKRKTKLDLSNIKPLHETQSRPKPTYEGKSGATRSDSKVYYDNIPACFIKRVAKRFKDGAVNPDGTVHHGRGNWMKFIQPVEHPEAGLVGFRFDIDWLREGYNHAMEHFLALKEVENPQLIDVLVDDHIGAVAWFLSVLAKAEECGLDVRRALCLMTPEADVEFKKRFGLTEKSNENS